MFIYSIRVIRVHFLHYQRCVHTVAGEEGDFKEYINPDSLQVVKAAFAEPSVKTAKFDEAYQFIRKGYFVLDKDSSSSGIVFNRTVGLKNGWKK